MGTVSVLTRLPPKVNVQRLSWILYILFSCNVLQCSQAVSETTVLKTEAPVSAAGISRTGAIAVATSRASSNTASVQLEEEVLLFSSARSESRRIPLLRASVTRTEYLAAGLRVHHALDFSEDGQVLVVSDGSNKLMAIDSSSGDSRGEIDLGNNFRSLGSVIDLRLSGSKVAVLLHGGRSGSGIVRIYNWHTHDLLNEWKLRDCSARELDWDLDGTHLATACLDPELGEKTGRYSADLYVFSIAAPDNVLLLNSGGRAGTLAYAADGSIWTAQDSDAHKQPLRIVDPESRKPKELRDKLGFGLSVDASSRRDYIATYAQQSKGTFSLRDFEPDLKIGYQGFVVWRTSDKTKVYTSPPILPLRLGFRLRLAPSSDRVIVWFERYPDVRVFALHKNALDGHRPLTNVEQISPPIHVLRPSNLFLQNCRGCHAKEVVSRTLRVSCRQ